jgi:hypothetical protein
MDRDREAEMSKNREMRVRYIETGVDSEAET